MKGQEDKCLRYLLKKKRELLSVSVTSSLPTLWSDSQGLLLLVPGSRGVVVGAVLSWLNH